MKNYEKPIILANNELSEGVFAASGAVAGGNGTLSVSVSVASTDGNKTCYFGGAVTNNSSETISDWNIQLSFDGAVATASVSNCNVSISGNTITITPAYDWNRTIEAGLSKEISGNATGVAGILSLA